MNNNNFNNYYKISDVIYKFEDNILMKFNSKIFYVDKLGNKRYSNNEYEFKLHKNNKSITARSILRHPSCNITMESKDNTNCYLILNQGDIFIIKNSINSLFSSEYNKNLITEFSNNQLMKFNRLTEDRFSMNLNNLFTINMKTYELMKFYARLNEINFLRQWEAHMNFIYCNNHLGEDIFVINSYNQEYNKESNNQYITKPKTTNNEKSKFDFD